mmetsp:Transcript_33386/g.84109  ORF Transcript_33386/g.84109 Transcript_33386/m.84109 type:complete len:492 (-) Transcript_33386:550-2025(-)
MRASRQPAAPQAAPRSGRGSPAALRAVQARRRPPADRRRRPPSALQGEVDLDVGRVDGQGQPLGGDLPLQHKVAQLGRHLHLRQVALQLVALQPLHLLQLPAQAKHGFAVGADDLHGHLERALHQRAHLVLHQRGQLPAIVAQQHLVAAAAQRADVERPHRGAQPPLRHRHLRHAGGALDVVRCASGYLATEVLLRGAPAQQDGQLGAQLGVKYQRAVLLLRRVREAQGAAAARHDAHALHHRQVRQQLARRGAHDGVPHLVLGHDALVLPLQDGPLLLDARDGAQHRAVKVRQADLVLVVAPRQQGGLVHQVGEVGAREAGGGRRDCLHCDVLLQRQIAPVQVHRQDLLPPDLIRPLHRHPAVKATGAQQRLVEHLRAVGGGDADDEVLLVAVEAVQLREQLVERLLALVVADRAQARVAPLGHGVDLVDEHDRGRLLARVGEELTHAHGAHAHVQLHKLAGGDGEKRHARLARNRLGEERLAGAGRAPQ